jgi:phage gp29-like protein
MQVGIPPSITHNPAEAWWLGLSNSADRSAQTILSAEAQAGRRQATVHELYAEMELKDGHFFSVVQTRLNGLLGLDRRLTAAPDAPEIGAWMERALARLPNFEGMLRALLRGLLHGFSAVELDWGYDEAGRLVVVDWREHVQEHFAFDAAGGLLLLAPPFGAGASPSGESSLRGSRAIPAPARKFLLLRFQADVRNPYGRGLAQHAYWYYYFKKNALKYWAIHNERFGAPTAVARCGDGVAAADRERLRQLLESLQPESSVVVPDAVQIGLLEAARGSDGSTFQRFIDWCNDEMSKIVLGATLTSGEGRRNGSLALGTIHQLVRQDYVEADARLLESVINEGLLRWLTELNFGPGAAVPRWSIRTESPVDLESSINVDRALLGFGVRLPEWWFHERYGRPVPAEGEATLRYDDANFYQYHLHYGILTVNEVRARLGLPPVAWGERQTVDPAISRGSGSASGEDIGRRPA